MLLPRPTIRQVAEAVGVNPSTVSRALNQPNRVTPLLREQIRKTAADMGYMPNVAARALTMRVSQLVPLIVPSIASPFYSALAAEIERVLHERDLHVMLCSANDGAEQEQHYLESLAPFQPPFIILAPVSDANFAMVRRLMTSVPVVLVGRVTSNFDLPCVAVDHGLAAEIAFSHLLNLGHTSIMAVPGPDHVPTARQWMDAYVTSALSANIRPVSMAGGVALDDGRRVARQWIDEENKPTAIMVADDLVAVGIAAELANSGVAIPTEVSIVGYDGLDITMHTSPPLTTVAEPLGDIARAAVTLAEDLRAGALPAVGYVTLEPSLLIRRSTCSPATSA